MSESQYQTIKHSVIYVLVIGAAAALFIGCTKNGPTEPEPITQAPQAQTVAPVVVAPVPAPPEQASGKIPKDGVREWTLTADGTNARLDFVADEGVVLVLAAYTPPGNGLGSLLDGRASTVSPIVLNDYFKNVRAALPCGTEQVFNVQVDAAVGPRIPEHGDFHGDQFLGAVYPSGVVVKARKCEPNRADTDSDSDPHSQPESDANTGAHPYAHSDSDANAYPDTQSFTHSDPKPDADSGSHLREHHGLSASDNSGSVRGQAGRWRPERILSDGGGGLRGLGSGPALRGERGPVEPRTHVLPGRYIRLRVRRERLPRFAEDDPGVPPGRCRTAREPRRLQLGRELRHLLRLPGGAMTDQQSDA